MLYHAGDSRHTQNTQINKGIGENENRVLFYGKNHTDFLANQYDPAILPLDICSKELKSGSCRVICTLMFIEALFTIAKMWR